MSGSCTVLLLPSPLGIDGVVGRQHRRIRPAVRDRGTMKRNGRRGAESQERSEPDQNHAQVINLVVSEKWIGP